MKGCKEGRIRRSFGDLKNTKYPKPIHKIIKPLQSSKA